MTRFVEWFKLLPEPAKVALIVAAAVVFSLITRLFN